MYNVIKKKVTYDDYKSIWWYKWLAMDHTAVRVVDDDFLFLLENGTINSPQQDSIIAGLKELYSWRKTSVENWDNYTKVLARDFKDKIKEDYNWFSDLRAQIVTDEMINYFLHDPYYLNVMYDVSLIGYAFHLRETVKFRTEAGHLYEDISDYLGIEKDSLVVRNHDDFNHYLGRYQNFRAENYFMDIKKDKDNILIYSEYLKDSLIYTSPIYPYSETLFFRTAKLNYPVHLIFDEKNNVEEINFGGVYGNGEGERPKFKKID